MSFASRIATAAADATGAQVVIGLGTNLGDRFDNLARAIDALRRAVGPLRSLSSIYASAPIGFIDQPEFWNAVAIFDTVRKPRDVLDRARQIERELGRVPTFPGGPRSIDLDLLFYDDERIVSETLVVPHPRLHERAFVLRPLAELQSERSHPVLGRTVRELTMAVAMQRADALPEVSQVLRRRLGLTVVQERKV